MTVFINFSFDFVESGMLRWSPTGTPSGTIWSGIAETKTKSALGGSAYAEGIRPVLFCFAVGSRSGHDLKL